MEFEFQFTIGDYKDRMERVDFELTECVTTRGELTNLLKTTDTGFVFEYPSMTKIAKDGFKLKVAEAKFRDSEIIVLLGAHGTGKTTFLSLMKDYLVPDAAYKSQTMLRSYPPHTVEEMLRLEIVDATMDPLFVTHVMEPLQIHQLMDRTIDHLSPEETQTLSLCMCLGKRAHIYLIDEPSAHLTPQQRDVATTVINNFVTLFNKTVFVAEHDFTMVARLAHKVILFEAQPSLDCVATVPQPWSQFSVGSHNNVFWEADKWEEKLWA